jgi:hypothetical protein
MTGGPKPKNGGIREFEFDGGDIAADLVSKFGPQGDLAAIFTAMQGVKVNKWHHYLPIYERYFGPWRGRPLRFLEIGVARGGSLAMWRRYFGPEAVIFGVDINPDCAQYNGRDGQVRIGSQDDADFLQGVVREMGGVDVVLDDGSHQMAHIRASLDILFPLLEMGGTYMIEDLHTAYWAKFGGGVTEPANFFNFIRAAVDDLHHWYHGGKLAHPEIAPFLTGLHIHDSIVVLDKAPVFRPTFSHVGRAGKRS